MKKTERWEEEFKSVYYDGFTSYDDIDAIYEEVKSFVHSLIAAERERCASLVEGMRGEENNLAGIFETDITYEKQHARNKALTDAARAIRGGETTSTS